MAMLSQILHNILNLKGGGEESDDSKITKRQLEFILNHFRAQVASQRTVANKALDGFYQELESVKVESTKDYRAYNRDVIILKSKTQIPSPITAHANGFVLQFVGFRDDIMSLQTSSLHTYNIDVENKYVTGVYFVVDNYLYLALKDRVTVREVFERGVFADPREVISANKGEDLFLGYDWEYPMPAAMLSQVNALIINNEYRWLNMLPADILNDGKDNRQ